MNKIMLVVLSVALVATVEDATAQWNVARFATNPNRVYTAFGLDPALVTTVGYARVVPIFGHRFQLAGDVGVAAARFDTDDFRARLGAYTSIVHWRSLHLTGGAAFVTRGTDNSIYRGFNFGADLVGRAGVYRPGWFVAGEFGFDKAVITHLRHSDWYRAYFDANVRDGWYLNAGGTFRYGVAAGVSVGGAELVGRGGWLRTEDFHDLIPPMFLSLGLGFGF